MEYREDFKKFLAREEIYEANQRFWQDAVRGLAKASLSDWVINEYGNGVAIRDGNPLFSARIGGDKAIRIIQSSRDLLKPVFASWNSEYVVDSKPLRELVIALQPYKNTYEDALQLIEAFISNQAPDVQEDLNQRYNSQTNRNRIKYLQNFFTKTGLRKNSWNLSVNKLKKEEFDLNFFKKIVNVSQTLYFYESSFDNKKIGREYNSIIIGLWKINRTISLKDRYDLESQKSKHDYVMIVRKTYSNDKAFVLRYNKEVDQLEAKVERLSSALKSQTVSSF